MQLKKYTLAMLMLVILMLILMLFNFNSDYGDANAVLLFLFILLFMPEKYFSYPPSRLFYLHIALLPGKYQTRERSLVCSLSLKFSNGRLGINNKY